MNVSKSSGIRNKKIMAKKNKNVIYRSYLI